MRARLVRLKGVIRDAAGLVGAQGYRAPARRGGHRIEACSLKDHPVRPIPLMAGQ